MRDEDLTAVLEQARKDVSPSASSISALVASEVVAQQRGRWRSRRSWTRRGVLIPIGLAVLAGTGAGTYAAFSCLSALAACDQLHAVTQVPVANRRVRWWS